MNWIIPDKMLAMSEPCNENIQNFENETVANDKYISLL